MDRSNGKQLHLFDKYEMNRLLVENKELNLMSKIENEFKKHYPHYLEEMSLSQIREEINTEKEEKKILCRYEKMKYQILKTKYILQNMYLNEQKLYEHG